MRHRLIIGSALVAFYAGLSQAADCSTLTGYQFGHTRVSAAVVVPDGTAMANPPGEPLPAKHAAACRVQATANPSADSQIRFEVWIPVGAGWNGKFEQVGNGGFAGAIPYAAMNRLLSLGYAVAGTDDGHEAADMTDAAWSLDHPEKIKDFGWRAIDETARGSKRILRRLTAKVPTHSYFSGCSDGGREALMMAQRFPTYFDGIIAGAPANSMTRLLTGGAVRSRMLNGDLAFFPAAQLALLQHHVLAACGTGAAYLADPAGCHVDLEALRCASGATENCLSEAQVSTAKILYRTLEDPTDGSNLYGFMPGAEAVRGSWDVWLTGTAEKKPTAGNAFTWNYLAYMVLKDQRFTMTHVSDADLARGEHAIGAVIDANAADLSAYKARGGKLIQYHGWNDPAIAPGFSLEYHQRVIAATANAREFYRLYMVPGMLHCRGGDAPTQVDWQSVLEDWVEKGAAPRELVATGGNGGRQTLSPVD